MMNVMKLGFSFLLLGLVSGARLPAGRVVFSRGIELSVEGLIGCCPSVQIFSVQDRQVSGISLSLVCFISGLSSSFIGISWWIGDSAQTPAETQVVWTEPDPAGAYSATSVWEVSSANWNSSSSYWCGTIKGGRVYKQKASLCWRVD
ncbi:uncharacterized protein si:ch211-1a19.2 [Lampris incognitus]|uniref:uncharacterized protein si:ch211-1a19.2 n=1 Tax=Lampris incognitus TaxID=2546036 RepID=UPI0024B56EAC|nr:uncharacterized protein si:ch211-1a19.2 [Lampris incognitus]